ncbi:hypothetical protein HDU92_002218 [Lobulomyces angularis]|nr:hypothetical protein HDU92_002218 [Lobulomyces angularis]
MFTQVMVAEQKKIERSQNNAKFKDIGLTRKQILAVEKFALKWRYKVLRNKASKIEDFELFQDDLKLNSKRDSPNNHRLLEEKTTKINFNSVLLPKSQNHFYNDNSQRNMLHFSSSINSQTSNESRSSRIPPRPAKFLFVEAKNTKFLNSFNDKLDTDRDFDKVYCYKNTSYKENDSNDIMELEKEEMQKMLRSNPKTSEAKGLKKKSEITLIEKRLNHLNTLKQLEDNLKTALNLIKTELNSRILNFSKNNMETTKSFQTNNFIYGNYLENILHEDLKAFEFEKLIEIVRSSLFIRINP